MPKNSPKLRCVLDLGVHLPPMYDRWDDAISTFCREESFVFLSDRFGYLNRFSPVNAAAISENRFPLSNYTRKFSDIMRTRAVELSTHCKSNGKRCRVMWSGGCDSTAVLAALIDVNDDLSFIDVMGTKTSLMENPDFYDFLVKKHIKIHIVSIKDIFRVALNYAKSGDLVIYGFPADQLFGSVIGQTWEGDTTKEHFSCFLKADKAIQQYEEAFQHYNLPIKTIAEFLWFNNFALKWDYVCNWTVASEHATHDNIVSFFNTFDFECWSLSNFDVLHKYDQKDVKNYKIEMKNFIYEVVALDSVFALKKVPSIAYAEMSESPSAPMTAISAIDDTGEIHTVHIPKGNSHRVGLYAASLLRKFLK